MDKKTLFSKAKPKTGKVPIGDDFLEVTAMSLEDRLDYQETESLPKTLRWAYLVRAGVKCLADSSLEEISEKIDPSILMEIGVKVMSLSGMTTESREDIKKK